MPLLTTQSAKSYGFGKLVSSSSSLSSFYSIASYTASSDISTVISFDSLDQTYKDLIIIYRAGATYGGSGGGSGGKFYVNNDTGANYTWAVIQGNGNGTSGGVTSTGIGPSNQWDFGASWAGNPNAWATGIMILQDYSSTTKKKNWRQIAGFYCGNGTNSQSTQYAGTYNSTSAINSLQFLHAAPYSDGNLRSGSQIQVFGIKG